MIHLAPCTEALHAPAILEILNHAIATSTALYDYEPRTLANMTTWFANKRAGDYPVIGAFLDPNHIEHHKQQGYHEHLQESQAASHAHQPMPVLIGFASYGAFRAFPAYKYTVEHSVYVHHEHRGQGLGKQLMHAIIQAAQAQSKHVMVGAIDASNAASIKLHADLGFETVGLMPQVGYKFGRWLDLALMQRVLSTPSDPVDG